MRSIYQVRSSSVDISCTTYFELVRTRREKREERREWWPKGIEYERKRLRRMNEKGRDDVTDDKKNMEKKLSNLIDEIIVPAAAAHPTGEDNM